MPTAGKREGGPLDQVHCGPRMCAFITETVPLASGHSTRVLSVLLWLEVNVTNAGIELA